MGGEFLLLLAVNVCPAGGGGGGEIAPLPQPGLRCHRLVRTNGDFETSQPHLTEVLHHDHEGGERQPHHARVCRPQRQGADKQRGQVHQEQLNAEAARRGRRRASSPLLAKTSFNSQRINKQMFSRT